MTGRKKRLLPTSYISSSNNSRLVKSQTQTKQLDCERKRRTRRFRRIFGETVMSGLEISANKLPGIKEPEFLEVEANNQDETFETANHVQKSNTKDESDHSAPESESVDDDAKTAITDEGKEVLLFEGNKAYVVTANPWPKRRRESITNEYRKPNPRLTKEELREQRSQVARRRYLVAQIQLERRKNLYKNGIYRLPLRLMKESSSRLMSWYKEHENLDSSKQGETVKKAVK